MGAPSYSETRRLRLLISGAVQGVGFRPFIHRLATEMHLTGFVSNTPQGALVEVQGGRRPLEEFLARLPLQKPPNAFIHTVECVWLDPAPFGGFEIRSSEASGSPTALILPDLATCPDCVRELFDPGDRRHLYPFINCTHCGPRFSIIESLPYDRPKTTMREFRMCDLCRSEYENTLDRRFHAQPIACPRCGPSLELRTATQDQPLARDGEALRQAADALHRGLIVAIKGIGGFQLAVLAANEEAVQRLRRLKAREEKPFAVMFETLSAVAQDCLLSPAEERLLASRQAPIVLLRRKHSAHGSVAPSVAPRNPCLGVMLPYSPLHHVLMRLVRAPIVATSGNVSDEPICIDNHEALSRLKSIADLFLLHDRRIVRHLDDSVARLFEDKELLIRRARGYAPAPIYLREPGTHKTVLAFGAHYKNTVALKSGPWVFLSQHIGDLETNLARDAFVRATRDLPRLYSATPQVVVADLHPDFASTRVAREWVQAPPTPPCDARAENPVFLQIQHHVAHVLSCMAENEIVPPVLGIAWDGTGYGSDGSTWGGEFFLINERSWKRAATLRSFPLVGGDKAAREPRRCGLALLWELYGPDAFSQSSRVLDAFSSRELEVLQQMLLRRVNTPKTTSMGRLFDAVASLAGIRQIATFEGQAAMELEFAADSWGHDSEAYPFDLDQSDPDLWRLDWARLVNAVLEDTRKGVPAAAISAKFHQSLVCAAHEIACRAGETKVVLSGGCFQNSVLLRGLVRKLSAGGYRVYTHQRVPPNDGGIALGQVIAAVNGIV